METSYKNNLVKLLAISAIPFTMNGCNTNFELFFHAGPPVISEYQALLESSTPELTAMTQYRELQDLPYLSNSTVIYFDDEIFDLTDTDNNAITVLSGTDDFIISQTFSIDSSTGTLVDAVDFYSYSGALTCTVTFKMQGQWTEANLTLTEITGETFTPITCNNTTGARSGIVNTGLEILMIDDEMNLTSDGAGGYLDGNISYSFALLDLPPNDPFGPITFQFEATTTLVP